MKARWALCGVLSARVALAAPTEEVTTAPPPPVPLESQQRKHFWRAFFETAFVVGVGSAWYWNNARGSGGSGDWDLNFSAESWKRKLDLSAVRFDDNLFTTNASSHPRAGLFYFQAVRGNGYSFATAYASSFTTSLFWEYVVEYREAPSINDIILTPAAGAVLGEATYRLGNFFAAGAPTWTNRVGAALFSPVATFNRWTDGQVGAPPPGGLRFSPDYFHRFDLDIGRVATTEGGERRDETSLALGTEVISHPDYRHAGAGVKSLGPGQWTRIGGRLLVDGDRHPRGMTLRTSTLLWGGYVHHHDEVPAGEGPQGWGLIFGLGSTFDYLNRMLTVGEDRLASAGLAGPMVDLRFDHGDRGVRFAVDSEYSFALVQSLAYNQYSALLSPDTIKSELRRRGYYYGQGLSATALLAVHVATLELALATDLRGYRSLDGRDRFQEKVRNDVTLSDTRAQVTASAALRPLGGPVRLVTRWERMRRRSWLYDRHVSSDETRVGVSASVIF